MRVHEGAGQANSRGNERHRTDMRVTLPQRNADDESLRFAPVVVANRCDFLAQAGFDILPCIRPALLPAGAAGAAPSAQCFQARHNAVHRLLQIRHRGGIGEAQPRRGAKGLAGNEGDVVLLQKEEA